MHRVSTRTLFSFSNVFNRCPGHISGSRSLFSVFSTESNFLGTIGEEEWSVHHDTFLSDGDIGRFFFDTDSVEVFVECGYEGRAAAHKWVEDQAIWWANKAAEVAHEGERFDCGVGVSFASFGL